MRTTLQDQITAAANQRQQAHKHQHFEWMLAHERLITHAVTLTLDPKKIDAYTAAFSRSLTRNHSEMIERYKDSVGLFAHLLDRSLFGNMSQRKGSPLLFVPVIEGLNNGQVPHFHCSVGIPENRFDVFEQKVLDAWHRVPFSGFSVKVVPYRDEGWLTYSTKGSKFPNRESIDWLNVRIPRSPDLITTKS
jgi:hypothetical protein